MRWVWLVLGVLAIIIGIVWTLQGVNILGGSFMSGKPLYAVVGVIVALIGVALVVLGMRRRAPAP
jgi:hypothetical protein